MNPFETDPYTAVVDAVEKEEGRMAPKKRLAVLAALACFAEYGYDATSTKMIAERAGIGEATIFRHFATKRDLLLRLAKPVVRHVLTPAAEEHAQGLLAAHGSDPRSILRDVILSRLAFMTTYEPLVRILFQEVLVNRDLRGMIAAEATPLFYQLTNVLTVVGAGSDMDRKRLLRTVGSLIAGYFIQRSVFSDGEALDDEAEVEVILDILMGGLPLAFGNG